MVYVKSMDEVRIRAAEFGDVAGIAGVHVGSWRETYSGMIPPKILDDPSTLEKRSAWWRNTLEDFPQPKLIAVAENNGRVIGFSMSDVPEDEDATWPRQLHVIYVLQAFQGRGAGSALLNFVLPNESPASLWVASPNFMARAFYRNRGFVEDGTVKARAYFSEMRMVRRGP